MTSALDPASLTLARLPCRRQQEEIDFERVEEEKPSLIRKYLDEVVEAYVKANLTHAEKVSALTRFWARMGTVDLSSPPAQTLSRSVGGLSAASGPAERSPLQVSVRRFVGVLTSSLTASCRATGSRKTTATFVSRRNSRGRARAGATSSSRRRPSASGAWQLSAQVQIRVIPVLTRDLARSRKKHLLPYGGLLFLFLLISAPHWTKIYER